MDKEKALERLTQAIEYLKNKGKARNQNEIAQKMERPRPHVSAALNGDPRRLTEGFLRRFAQAYADDIRAEWLIDGSGPMAVPSPLMRPHYDTHVAAGFLAGISDPADESLRDPVPGAPDYDFTIEAEGRSMEPQIISGDILLCRLATDPLNPPIGKICVCDTREGPVVKLLDAFHDNTLFLHSLNPSFPDIRLDPSDLLALAPVVALLRDLTR